MLIVFCRTLGMSPTLGEPDARIAVPFLKMMLGATYAVARSPGFGITRKKCPPDAAMLTPSTKSPLLQGSAITEWSTVATLPLASTTVRWLLPGGGDEEDELELVAI